MTLPAWLTDGTISANAYGHVLRNRTNGRPHEPRRIDLPDRSKGYRNVVLPDPDKRWRTHKAHRVVWMWFHGEIPCGLQVDHINGVKDDNRIANLRLVSPSENIRHSYRSGRTRPWSNVASKSDQAAEMAQRRTEGALLREIADEFGISLTHANRLVKKGGERCSRT